ncbi:hypothetical protein [Burkholderia perseverans]|uniref:hypothetical protein n=1 Tax=Burkholderia perseverans TaxID=2615214 RepID=UPI001FEF2966|nr:hypothetical protein [Burkholderia perseverans]
MRCARLDLVGRLVLVAEPAATGRHDWIVTLQGGGIVAPGAFTGVVMRRTRALVLDSSLTPIRGEPLADSESASRTRPVPVA